MSTLSERNPLGALPTADIPADGTELLLGRSSNSSNYQLSANRLISRVHVRVKYNHPSASNASGSVQIECLGWNGIKVHCRGKVHALGKGDVFTSDKPSAEIMLDVQETRVILAWPAISRSRDESVASDRNSDRTWTEDVSPSRRRTLMSSPPLAPRSPESPTPGDRPIVSADQTFIIPEPGSSQQEVQIYEDPSSEPELADDQEESDENHPPLQLHFSPSKSGSFGVTKASFNTEADEFSDHDEENDPIVHSFGPFGENILPNLAAFATSSPVQPRRREPLRPSHSPQKRNSSESTRRTGSGLGLDLAASSSTNRSFNESPVKNHVINQLAFSRLHSMPLSAILGNLPAELKNNPSSSVTDDTSSSAVTSALSSDRLKNILDAVSCIGEIPREGKDAAGKPLENEYYYVPEMDSDVMRRDAFIGSRGSTGLRAVRKSHKVCCAQHVLSQALCALLFRHDTCYCSMTAADPIVIAILLEATATLVPCAVQHCRRCRWSFTSCHAFGATSKSGALLTRTFSTCFPA